VCVTDNMLLCVAAVQRINEVFSAVKDEFDEFSYCMKVYRYVTLFLNKCTHIFDHDITLVFLGQLEQCFRIWMLQVVSNTVTLLWTNRICEKFHELQLYENMWSVKLSQCNMQCEM